MEPSWGNVAVEAVGWILMIFLSAPAAILVIMMMEWCEKKGR
jgi:hypothetical protein